MIQVAYDAPQYAREKRIPVLAFIREDKDSPGHMIETDPESRRKLTEFKKVLNDLHHREQWVGRRHPSDRGAPARRAAARRARSGAEAASA